MAAPSTFALTRRIVGRAFGAVALAAALSLWVQIDGLAGRDGILPVADAMAGQRAALGDQAFWWTPTPLLYWPNDALLHGLCATVALAGAALLLGLLPALAAALVALGMLALVHACGTFLQFQWDGLLVETACVLALYLPWTRTLARAREREPGRLARWMLWFVLFRLVLESGVVKLTSGDPTWRQLSALTFHYWTQPLPHRLSVHVHELPEWVHAVSCAAMFVIELVLPFGVFAPWRRVRHAAALGIAALQVLILLTGNYGFFNLLTLVLCASVLDDRAWSRRRATPAPVARAPTAVPAPGLSAPATAAVVPARDGRVQRALTVPAALLAALAGGQQLVALWIPPPRPTFPQWEAGVLGALRDGEPRRALHQLSVRMSVFHAVNPYGLFRVMTTSRPEIRIEGSLDGGTWRPYRYRWAPDEDEDVPRWCQPHMPRLDWRLWFEALAWEHAWTARRAPYEPSPWFGALVQRLVEGSAPVIALFEEDPFPGEPPRFIRATLLSSTFAPPRDRHDSGRWWTRERLTSVTWSRRG